MDQQLLEVIQNLPQKEMRALSRAFNKPIVRKSGGETLYHVIKTPPHQTAWLIMGSQDLIQVERMANKWLAAKEKPKLIIFSGHGPLFSITEADIMEAHFKKLTRGCHIETLKEREAMNSGENAEFIKVKLQSYPSPIFHFVISGTPPAITRQVLTVEEHFKTGPILPFETISGYPPSSEEVDLTYFQSAKSKGSYNLLALKEAASFLNYSVNTDFMAPWSPTKTEILDVVNTLNLACLVLGGRAQIKQPEKFAHDFVSYIAKKPYLEKPLELSYQIEPLARFISKIFDLTQ